MHRGIYICLCLAFACVCIHTNLKICNLKTVLNKTHHVLPQAWFYKTQLGLRAVHAQPPHFGMTSKRRDSTIAQHFAIHPRVTLPIHSRANQTLTHSEPSISPGCCLLCVAALKTSSRSLYPVAVGLVPCTALFLCYLIRSPRLLE